MSLRPVRGKYLEFHRNEKLGVGDVMYSRNGLFSLAGLRSNSGRFCLRARYLRIDGQPETYYKEEFDILADHPQAHLHFDEKGYLRIGRHALLNHGDTLSVAYKHPDGIPSSFVMPHPYLVVREDGLIRVRWKDLDRGRKRTAWESDKPKNEARKSFGPVLTVKNAAIATSSNLKIVFDSKVIVDGVVKAESTEIPIKPQGTGTIILVLEDHVSIPHNQEPQQEANTAYRREFPITQTTGTVAVRTAGLYMF